MTQSDWISLGCPRFTETGATEEKTEDQKRSDRNALIGVGVMLTFVAGVYTGGWLMNLGE